MRMHRVALAALSLMLLGGGAQAAITNLGSPDGVVTKMSWGEYNQRTRLLFVPSDQPSHRIATLVPLQSPEYHLAAVAPSVPSYCVGCVPMSSAYTTELRTR